MPLPPKSSASPDSLTQPVFFLGEKSKLADKQALARAQAMEQAGAHVNTIWNEAKWGREPGGHWVFEAPKAYDTDRLKILQDGYDPPLSMGDAVYGRPSGMSSPALRDNTTNEVQGIIARHEGWDVPKRPYQNPPGDAPMDWPKGPAVDQYFKQTDTNPIIQNNLGRTEMPDLREFPPPFLGNVPQYADGGSVEPDQDPLVGNLQNEASNFASEAIPNAPQNTPAAMASRGEISMGDAVRQQAAQSLSPQAFSQARETGAYSTPLLGSGLSARDAIKAYNEGRTRDAAISAAGIIPELGGIIVGRFSKHPAVAPMLDLAEDLEKRGASKEDIWKQTVEANKHPDAIGAVKTGDKWGAELDDSQMRLAQLQANPYLGPGAYQFGDVNHPGYKEAYGDPNYVMRGRVRPEGTPRGSFLSPLDKGDNGYIDVEGRTPQEAKGTALHELQHSIAEREGMPQGTSPSMAPFPEDRAGGAWPFYDEALKDYMTPPGLDAYQARFKFDNPAQAAKSYQGYLDQIDQIAKTGKIDPSVDKYLTKRASFDWYQRNEGENLAEAVRERANLAPDQRRALPFWESMPHPYEEQTRLSMPEEKATGGEVTEQKHELPIWVRPYFGAGIRAHSRGENFYGGTPQYEEELKLFKQAHEPEAPVAPTAPEGYAKGGKVTTPEDKKLGSIADGFSKRLDNIHKLLTSLEKAYAKKPNSSLKAKIASKRDEAQRIEAHINKVKAAH